MMYVLQSVWCTFLELKFTNFVDFYWGHGTCGHERCGFYNTVGDAVYKISSWDLWSVVYIEKEDWKTKTNVTKFIDRWNHILII